MLMERRRWPITTRDDTWIVRRERGDDTDNTKNQKSDGKHGTVELGKLAGLSKDTVHNRWESWAKMGLGENIPVKGGTRFKRSFDLEDFGIKVPDIKVEEVKEEAKKEPKEITEASK